MTLHLFHRWGKWEQEPWQYRWIPPEARCNSELLAKIPFNDCIRQKRKCEICGKQQMETVGVV